MAQTFSFPNYGLFNATYYLQQNPDVATSWTGTPLQHYIQYGALEGRAPTAWFNADFYRQAYTDLQSMNALQLFNHYCNYGYNEGRVPMLNFSNFNGVRYLLDNPDVAAAGYTAGNAISHFVNYGEYEGRVAYADNGVVINPVVNEGDVFTLTTGVDNLAGTQFNDTFDASATGTLQNFDSLDGMGGVDTLYATITANVTPAELLNLEVISATATNTGTLNLINGGQVTNVNNNGSTAALTVSNIAAGADLSVSNTDAATVFSYATTSGTQEANLTVDGLGTLAAPGVSIAGVETINLTASGNDSNFSLTAANATSVTINGEANLTMGTTGTVSASLWDGSDATGDLNLTIVAQTGVLAATDVTVNGGFGDDVVNTTAVTQDQSISAGAGDDLIINETVASTDTIDGGIGQDTLSTLSAAALLLDDAARTTFTNLEELTIEDQFGGGAFSLANIGSSFNQMNFENSAAAILAANTTVTGSAGALTITLGESIAAANTGALGANLTAADTGTATTDSVTIVNLQNDSRTNTDADVFGGANVTSTGYEAVTVETGDGVINTRQDIGTLTITADVASAATSLTLAGNNSVDINTLASNTTSTLTVDGSGLTAQAAGTRTLDINEITLGVAGSASVIGSAGDDFIVGATARSSTILGGAGADTLTGSTLADSIDGGTGNDSLTGAGGNDVLRGGEGADTINVSTAAGLVTVDGGAGDDLILVGATLNAGDSIDGGAGTNTVAISTALIADFAGVTNTQTLRLDAAMTQNLARFTGTTLNNVAFNAAGATTSATNAAAVTGALILNGATSSTVSLATDTTADATTVGGYTNVAGALGTVVLNDYETVTFNDGLVTTAANTQTIGQLTSGDMTGLVLTGAVNKVVTAITAANLDAIDASANTGTVVIGDLNTSNTNGAVASTFTGSATAANNITGSGGADVITGGSAADTLFGRAGADTINGAGGIDSINGGADADSLTGGAGVDSFNQASLTDSVARSASSFAGANVAANDSLTFGGGVDVITDFAAGTDGDVFFNLFANGALPTTLIGEAVANLTAGQEVFFASGSYNALTGQFTIAADGTGADTLIVQADNAVAASDSLLTNASMVVLVGVDSDNLVAANFDI